MKKFQRYLILTIILLLLIGCSSNKDITYDESYNINSLLGTEKMREEISQESDEAVENLSQPMNKSPLEPEKVIIITHMHFETLEFEKSNKTLNDLIEKHKAYIENSNIEYNIHHNNKSYRSGFYTIRVPKSSISNFKSALNKIGNIMSENTSKEDVSKRYKDTKSRLKIIEVKEERITSLLSKANKIEDIIKLEEELSKTMQEKEELKGQLIDIDDKIDFSTININIQEVEKLTNQTNIDTRFATRFINAIGDSIFFFKKALENLILLLVYAFPFILIIGVIIYLIIKTIKRIRKPKE